MLKSKKTVASVTASLAKMINDLSVVADAQAVEASRQADIIAQAVERGEQARAESSQAKQVAAKIEALLN